MDRKYKTTQFSVLRLKAYHEDPGWNKVKDLCGTTFDESGASHNKGKFADANEAVLKIMVEHGCLQEGN